MLVALHIGASNGASQSPKAEALYGFPNISVSATGPVAALVISKNGHLFGTTKQGGAACGAIGCGTVFELAPPASSQHGWTETLLYSFTDQNGDGQAPSASLVFGPDGVLYGTTAIGGGTDCGGGAGCGTVFALTPPAVPGGTWTEAILYRFTGRNADGHYPEAGLIHGPNGALYGTTGSGGIASACSTHYESGCGTIFELSQTPEGAWRETILYQFTGQNGDGANPRGNLVFGDGVIYGTTQSGGAGPCNFYDLGCGTVFKLSPPTVKGGAWTEQVLYSFMGPNGDGSNPVGGVTVANGGVLYGTTAYGGPSGCGNPGNPPGCGTVFHLTPPATPGAAWTESVLHFFTGIFGCCNGDGANPMASVTIGANVLYGTTFIGGEPCTIQNSVGCGTIFWLTPPSAPGGAWTEASVGLVKYKAGLGPLAGLVMRADGVFFGTASGSGFNAGTVFAFVP